MCSLRWGSDGEQVSWDQERPKHQRDRSLAGSSHVTALTTLASMPGGLEPAAKQANERAENIRNLVVDSFDGGLADEASRRANERAESSHDIDDWEDAGLADEGWGLLRDQSYHSVLSSRGISLDSRASSRDGLSSFGQTLFNSCNALMGAGLLSLPYAMRLAGWFGLLILLFFSLLTCYTAKLLGKILDYVPYKKLRDGPGAYTIYGFHDMSELVLGKYGRPFISVIFVVETFGYCCVYLIVEGTNLQHQLRDHPWFQGWGKAEFMSMSALIFLPSCLLRNLSWLSYFSALGVICSMFMLLGVLVTGLLPDTSPAPGLPRSRPLAAPLPLSWRLKTP